jgi:hypothetical protein
MNGSKAQRTVNELALTEGTWEHEFQTAIQRSKYRRFQHISVRISYSTVYL